MKRRRIVIELELSDSTPMLALEEWLCPKLSDATNGVLSEMDIAASYGIYCESPTPKPGKE